MFPDTIIITLNLTESNKNWIGRRKICSLQKQEIKMLNTWLRNHETDWKLVVVLFSFKLFKSNIFFLMVFGVDSKN